MATWINHLRIADHFLKLLPQIHPVDFVAGNIAPDSGEPNEDWSEFTPSGDVSHWRITSPERKIDFEHFYQGYVAPADQDKRSFYLGYYLHLVSDKCWAKYVYFPKRELYAREFAEDEGFIWTMKKDWYDLDRAYIEQSENFEAYRIFNDIDSFPNRFLPFFPDHAFTRRFKYIRDFYKEKKDLSQREYRYLTPDETDHFVYLAIRDIEALLLEKEVINSAYALR